MLFWIYWGFCQYTDQLHVSLTSNNTPLVSDDSAWALKNSKKWEWQFGPLKRVQALQQKQTVNRESNTTQSLSLLPKRSLLTWLRYWLCSCLYKMPYLKEKRSSMKTETDGWNEHDYLSIKMPEHKVVLWSRSLPLSSLRQVQDND